MVLQYIKNITIFLVLLSTAGCKKTTETKATKNAPITVSVVKVQQNDIKEYLTFNGVTQYQKKENIRSNVTGYISYMPFKIGDRISSGQTFASLRTKEQDALKEAVKIDSSLAKFIGPILISSNATGVITVLNVTKNDYVAEGDVLATIVQPKSLVVQVNVPYEYRENVQIGSKCELLLPDGEIIPATINDVMPTIDALSQSQTFLIDLPKSALPENLNVQVKFIQNESPNALTVPKKALQTNELLTAYWVMKIVNDSIAIKAMVTPKLKNDSLVQIQSDKVHLNDLIILEGAYQMQDSTLVKYK
ncbi:MAG: HlyD family efflux transporter periplasmic adaptor subunit [Flavobacteriaceae bacterium]|nr:HlyD family efflux transporter periplasmic adaptor subunit [Flavobacteriaceae bacterium]